MTTTNKITDSIIRTVLAPVEETDSGRFLVTKDIIYNLQDSRSINCKDNQGIIDYFDEDGLTLISMINSSFKKKEVFRYTFSNGKPEIETKVTVDGERSFVKNAETVKVGDSFEARVSFRISEDECIYGLGQQENGIYNYRNVKEYLYHNNMKIPMPVFLSSKGYAVFFDATCMMTYEEKDNIITVGFDAVDKIDYYIINANSYDGLISAIRALTGENTMLPRWAYGYVQSKERYKSQTEILETAERFEKEDIPVSCLVLDWQSWEEGKWGNKIFDKSRFPDAKKMVDELHKKGISFMVSIWPNCKEGCENNEEFASHGKLLCNYSTYDAFDDEARDIYWKQCEKELFSAGTDAWWCDSTEPFTPDWNGEVKRPEEERYRLAIESTNKYLDARSSSAYCLMHSKGIYEHQRKADSSKRIVNLTRAGYPGVQKYGTILWSGDIAATWECLRAQVAEGLSIGMSGIANWTLDAGAFFAGNTKSWRRWCNRTDGNAPWFWHGDFEDGVDDLGYRELYTRWLQLAAFLPIMRSHGTDTPREPWNFGEKGTKYYDTIVKYIKLRYKLLPYIYSLAARVYTDSYTIMRSLMFDFSKDEKVRNISDSYMFGPAFYVCPVTEAYEYGPDSIKLDKKPIRKVYFPEGSDWYDFETHELYKGGNSYDIVAPVEKLPLFVKEGSIIPMSEGTNGSFDRVMVFSGADASFEFLNDSGDGYEYETKGFVKLSITWKDKEKKLVITDKDGQKLDKPVDII